MVPWKNSWFQVAFFAWLVSGALLIVDYAPKIPANSGWMKAFQREPRQPSEAPAKRTPPTEQQSPAKDPAPTRQAPSPASEKPVTKTPNALGTNTGSAELDQGKAAYDRRDYAQAMQWYQKAAARGNAEAEYNISWLYDNGFGVTANHAEAVRWYRKSAEQGNAQAEYEVGSDYDNYPGPSDYAEAMRWYQKAAAQGNARAEQMIGMLYARAMVFRKIMLRPGAGCRRQRHLVMQ
jgi:tetratricopeptide (TPR) repeat protein